MTTKWYFICLLFFTTSCIEEYLPELDDFDNVLVVDGQITNEPGPYTVKLSISAGLDITTPKLVSDAIVKIMEEGGEEETLIEVKDGEYQTLANGMQGSIGKKYKISINLPDGRKYTSAYEVLKTPTTIESIENEIAYRTIEEENAATIGYQFYANTGLPADKTNYYVWFLEATYRFRAQLSISSVYEGYYRNIESADSLQNCYVHYTLNEVFTANTEALPTAQKTRNALAFIPGNNAKLHIRYSLLTKQYTVSKAAHEFWSGIQKQTASGGSLYTFQPYQIRGNVKNIVDSDEPVLGYFMAAGVTKKRFFVDKLDNLPPLSPCTVISDFGLIIAFSAPADWPIYFSVDTGENGIASGTCIDCTVLNGAALERPVFWED